MERTLINFSLDAVQIHAGCYTVDRSFISVPFIGAVGIWWETDSHSDKVPSSNYFGFPFHIEIAADHVNCLKWFIVGFLKFCSFIFQEIHNICCQLSVWTAELPITNQCWLHFLKVSKQCISNVFESIVSLESEVQFCLIQKQSIKVKVCVPSRRSKLNKVKGYLSFVKLKTRYNFLGKDSWKVRYVTQSTKTAPRLDGLNKERPRARWERKQIKTKIKLQY